MTIAPNPLYPERGAQSFERKMALNPSGLVGPLRHEEGVATDTDVPNDFARGAYYDTAALPGTINQINRESVFKYADETMHERAHVGSASWESAPEMLGDFVQGAGVGQGPPEFERVMNSGGIINRRAISVVYD
jgi:hypothetical protein